MHQSNEWKTKSQRVKEGQRVRESERERESVKERERERDKQTEHSSLLISQSVNYVVNHKVHVPICK